MWAPTEADGKEERPRAVLTAIESSLVYVLPLPSASADGLGTTKSPFFRDFSPGEGKGAKAPRPGRVPQPSAEADGKRRAAG